MVFTLRRSARKTKSHFLDNSEASGVLKKCFPIPTKKITYFKRKKEQKQQFQEEEEEEEDHLVVATPPPGQRKEAEVIGGVEVIPLDISSSPERTKPNVDHLSHLQPVYEPHCHKNIPEESLEKLRDAATVFMADLVSHLEKTAHKLDIADMVRNANECFTVLRSLKVDYRPFHGEACTVIKKYQELKQATEEKNNTSIDSGLEADYEKGVVDADTVREELLKAENKLMSAQSNHNSTTSRIKELTAMLGRLQMEEGMQRNEIATLTAERDCCNASYMLAEKNVEMLYSMRQETVAEIEGIKARCDAAEEETRRSLNRLRNLV